MTEVTAAFLRAEAAYLEPPEPDTICAWCGGSGRVDDFPCYRCAGVVEDVLHQAAELAERDHVFLADLRDLVHRHRAGETR